MGQDLRQFLMATLTGGQGKRGHQISLPNSMTQIVGFRLKGGIKKKQEGGKKRKWEGSRKGRREGKGQPGGRWTANGGKEGTEPAVVKQQMATHTCWM